MNDHEVIGYTTEQLVAAMGESGIHCSLDRFRRLACEIQRRALAALDASELALDKLAEVESRLGLSLLKEQAE